MTDPALDFSHDAMYAATRTPENVDPFSDPWLYRRGLTFGASDVAPLMIGLGMREPAYVTKRIRENARVMRGTFGAPRVVAEKAGAKAPHAHSGGGERERELLFAWAKTLPADGVLDPATATHASVVPRCFWSPIRDPFCPQLAVSLDGWISDRLGEWCVVEAKCAEPRDDEQTGHLPWYWNVQVQAQLAATGKTFGMLVLGRGWAYRDGPIEVWRVDRDESCIAEIRQAVTRGWEMVERVRADLMKARAK